MNRVRRTFAYHEVYSDGPKWCAEHPELSMRLVSLLRCTMTQVTHQSYLYDSSDGRQDAAVDGVENENVDSPQGSKPKLSDEKYRTEVETHAFMAVGRLLVKILQSATAIIISETTAVVPKITDTTLEIC